jgi:2,3-dihydroxybenzoate-AMP ligase
MLEGAVDWPAAFADRYRREGWWTETTLFDIVDHGARDHPHKTALVAGPRRLSYAELRAQALQLAARLADGLIAPLDRVVVQLPNIIEFVVVYFALVRIGAIPVMAMRSHRQAEVRHFLRASGASAYVIADRIGNFDYRAMAEQLRGDEPALRHVIVVGEAAPGQLAYGSLLREGAGASVDVRVDPAEVGTMLLSGGTTSMSKLIPRTHRDYVLNARLCGAAAGFDGHTVFMAVLPLAHNYNLASPGLLGALFHGGSVVLAPSADAAAVFETVRREGVTVIAALLPLITAWLAAPLHDALASLRVVQNGGARLAPELRERLRQRFGCIPQEIYGTAEGLINMTRLDDDDERLLHSSGTPVCAADEIRVVDDDGREVADGEPGELITRGPYTIRGYYDAMQKNAEAFTEDGFYRMGDIVRKRGRSLYAEGRCKDMINRGGEKISCEEVENLMFAHPKVKAATLVAMPDAQFGEKACAFVIPHPGQQLSFDELIGFLRQQDIASYKLPERLEIVAEFPLSPVGKILKRELRESIAAKLRQESAS